MNNNLPLTHKQVETFLLCKHFCLAGMLDIAAWGAGSYGRQAWQSSRHRWAPSSPGRTTQPTLASGAQEGRHLGGWEPRGGRLYLQVLAVLLLSREAVAQKGPSSLVQGPSQPGQGLLWLLLSTSVGHQ